MHSLIGVLSSILLTWLLPKAIARLLAVKKSVGEFGHVTDVNRTRLSNLELTVQQIGCCLANRDLIGPVLLPVSLLGLQRTFLHELTYQFLTNSPSLGYEVEFDYPIRIARFPVPEGIRPDGLESGMLIRLVETL